MSSTTEDKARSAVVGEGNSTACMMEKKCSDINMTFQKSTHLCNSAVKTPVELKKTVEYILAEKEEKRLESIQAKKFQSKHSGMMHSSRKTLESNRTGSYTFFILLHSLR